MSELEPQTGMGEMQEEERELKEKEIVLDAAERAFIETAKSGEPWVEAMVSYHDALHAVADFTQPMDLRALWCMKQNVITFQAAGLNHKALEDINDGLDFEWQLPERQPEYRQWFLDQQNNLGQDKMNE